MEIKWAKGTLEIDPASTSKGHLVFVPGVELVVEFSLESMGSQTIFRAQGVGQTGPLKGVVYDLLGWAATDETGAVTEVAGGILGVKETNAASLSGGHPRDNGLAGEKPGTIGYFRLSKDYPSPNLTCSSPPATA